MRKFRVVVPICTAALLSLPLVAGASESPPPAATGAWMADIASRRADLLAHYQRFASAATSRAPDRAPSPWWRRIAARPTPRTVR
jgi:hypothetical protein